MDTDGFTAFIEYAKDAGVGFWQIVFAIILFILATRPPAIIRVVAEYLNDRKRITGDLQLKKDAAGRRVAKEIEKRSKGVAKK